MLVPKFEAHFLWLPFLWKQEQLPSKCRRAQDERWDGFIHARGYDKIKDRKMRQNGFEQFRSTDDFADAVFHRLKCVVGTFLGLGAWLFAWSRINSKQETLDDKCFDDLLP